MIVTPMESFSPAQDAVNDGLTPAARDKILELRHLLLSAQEENLKLRERIRQLEAAAAPEHNIIFEKGVYWTMQGNSRQGPYCPACHDKTAKLVRLHYSHSGTPGVYWICKSCQQNW